MTQDIQQFDFSVNLLKALLWQYDDAPNIRALIEQKQAWTDLNNKQFWENWVTNVFDLRTANDFGLSVWSIILNQPIYGLIAPDSIAPAWGFSSTSFNFGQGNFISPDGTQYPFPTEIARILLQIRYFQLTSSGTVPEINRMLKYVFGSYGLAYLVDNLNMTQAYLFTFPVNSTLKYIFNNFDVLPRASGVKSIISYGDFAPFGFSITSNNFDNGNFGS